MRGDYAKGRGQITPARKCAPLLVLLVPGHDLYLTDYLAVAHVYGLRREYTQSVGIFAVHIKREATLAHDLVHDPMLHISAKDILKVLGYLLLAPQHIGRARWSVAIDDADLGVVGIEVEHRIEIVLLLGTAQGLEV